MPNVWHCRLCGVRFSAGIYRATRGEEMMHFCDLWDASITIETTLADEDLAKGKVTGHADWVGWITPPTATATHTDSPDR